MSEQDQIITDEAQPEDQPKSQGGAAAVEINPEQFQALVDLVKNQAAMIEELRQMKSAQQQPTPSVSEVDDELRKLDEKFLASPSTFLSSILQNLKTQIEQEVEKKISSAVSANRFWGEFLATYPEMRNATDVLQQVLASDAAEISRMKDERQIMEHLYKRAKKIVSDRFSKLQQTTKPTAAAQPVQPGTLVWPTKPKNERAEPVPVEVDTLSDALKKVRRKMFSSS